MEYGKANWSSDVLQGEAKETMTQISRFFLGPSYFIHRTFNKLFSSFLQPSHFISQNSFQLLPKPLSIPFPFSLQIYPSSFIYQFQLFRQVPSSSSHFLLSSFTFHFRLFYKLVPCFFHKLLPSVVYKFHFSFFYKILTGA